MHARVREEGIKEFRIVTHGNAWSVYFAETEAICRNRPAFSSREDWRKVQVDRLVAAN